MLCKHPKNVKNDKRKEWNELWFWFSQEIIFKWHTPHFTSRSSKIGSGSHQDHSKSFNIITVADAANLPNFRRFFSCRPHQRFIFFFLFTVIYSRPCQLIQTKRQRFNCGHARTEASDACSTFEPKMSRNETLVIQDRFRVFRFSLTLSSVECASLVYLLLTLTVQFRYSYKKISKFPWFKREFKFEKNLKVFFRTSLALEILLTTLDSYKNTGTSVIITSFIFLLQLPQKIIEKLWF